MTWLIMATSNICSKSISKTISFIIYPQAIAYTSIIILPWPAVHNYYCEKVLFTVVLCVYIIMLASYVSSTYLHKAIILQICVHFTFKQRIAICTCMQSWSSNERDRNQQNTQLLSPFLLYNSYIICFCID